MRTREDKNVMVLASEDQDVWYDGAHPLTKVTLETCVKYNDGTDDDYAETKRATGKVYQEYVVSIYEKGFGWAMLGVTRKSSKAYRIAERRASVYITRGLDRAIRA